jgi:hypothetical protein
MMRGSMTDESPEEIGNAKIIIRSNAVLGNGRIDDVRDIVYVPADRFDSLHTREMAKELEEINFKLAAEGRRYVLAAPGRWGSSDPNLGIPVKWQQISHACVLAELQLHDYRIDPSQGTHFFHNLTTLNIGYFPVTPFSDDSFADFSHLESAAIVSEMKFFRHVKLDEPLLIVMDGRLGRGVVGIREDIS